MFCDFCLAHGSIKPLRHYCFIRDQGYEFVDSILCDEKRGLDSILEYDEEDQLFWCPENITRTQLRPSRRYSTSNVFHASVFRPHRLESRIPSRPLTRIGRLGICLSN